MTHRIDTLADFLAAREAMRPVFITSQAHGRVEVPCCNTLLVAVPLIAANHWNPNAVPADKMELLKTSILDNGFCFPVVTIWDDESERFIVCDGFHRTTIGGPEWLDFDYLPVVVLQGRTLAQQMTATMQFNKARGMHQVDLDAELIRRLLEQGLNEEQVAEKLGLDPDTVHRYKQLTGVAELFAKSEYSVAWEMVDDAT